MPSPHSIPYFAPAERLPAPLPSIEEIEAGQEMGPEKCIAGQRVVRVGQHFVVKHGWWVRPVEGLNMLYVSDHTTVAVPHVYAIYQQEDAKGRRCTYIVMEYVDGRPLNECWSSLGSEVKETISSQLRGVLDQLRKLPPPSSDEDDDDAPVFKSVDNGPLHDGLFWTEGEEVPEINGPFRTEGDIAEALVRKLEQEGSDFKPERASYYRRVLPHVLRGDGKPTFTHADLQTKNIMLRPNGALVLLDWEWAGWYPRYWEYAIAVFGCGFWVDDFHAWVPKFLDEYPNEYLWLATIRGFLWY
ncbi:hypothetical protein VTI28DRAFT_7466 [Corynascus sepedonium]